MQNDQELTIVVAAPASLLGVSPYQSSGSDHDGGLLVTLFGWSKPSEDLATYFVVPPSKIEEGIRRSWRRQVDPWASNPIALEAFATAGEEFAYVDPRRLSQCRDYGARTGVIRCQIFASDEQFGFGVQLPRVAVANLSDDLMLILTNLEKTRGDCPT